MRLSLNIDFGDMQESELDELIMRAVNARATMLTPLQIDDWSQDATSRYSNITKIQQQQRVCESRELSVAEKALIETGRMIEAVRAYHTRAGLGLSESKDYVDAYAATFQKRLADFAPTALRQLLMTARL